jgi:hypothetical protein
MDMDIENRSQAQSSMFATDFGKRLLQPRVELGVKKDGT